MADFTPRDLDIQETLTRRVRVLSIDHARRIWWPRQTTSRNTRRRLRQLARRGFIERRIVNVRTPLDVHQPLAIWRPGEPIPDFVAVSQADRERWPIVAEPTELFTATRLSANLFGSTAVGLPKLFHIDHDLLLAQVYVVYRITQPDLAQLWLSKDALPKTGLSVKHANAFLIDDSGKPFRVVESAGRFTPLQLEAFHEYCNDLDFRYELW